jgi:endonuclease IV
MKYEMKLEVFISCGHSLDEILELCDTVDGPVPVINFAHYHARENGLLRSSADFADLLERTKRYVDGTCYHTSRAWA